MKVIATPALSRVTLYESTRDDSPDENIDQQGGSCQRIVNCDWNSVDTALLDILGKVTLQGTTLLVQLPQSYPNASAKHYYLADEVKLEGRGYVDPDGGKPTVGQHLKARLTITYRPVTRLTDLEPNPTCLVFEEEFRPAIEFLSLAGRKLYWDAAKTLPLGDDEGPGVLHVSGEWVCRLKRLPTLPAGWLSLKGCVNNGPITSGAYGVTFATGTLLAQLPKLEWHVGPFGQGAWTLETCFLYNEMTWNKFPRAGTATPATVYDSTGVAYNPYPSADLTPLMVTL